MAGRKWYDIIKKGLDEDRQIKIMGPLPSGAEKAVNKLRDEGYSISIEINYEANGAMYTILTAEEVPANV